MMSQMAGASSTHKHPVASGILPNTYAWKMVVVALLLLAMASWVNGCNERRAARADPEQCLDEKADEWKKIPAGYYKGDDGKCVAGTRPTPPEPKAETRKELTEALVLMAECHTPCSAPIAWPFKIRTEGRPIEVKFRGVPKPVRYPGEGDFKAPTEMRSGETEFVSTDETHPNVRVQVYKKITVRGGR